jgi:hypothetical protein
MEDDVKMATRGKGCEIRVKNQISYFVNIIIKAGNIFTRKVLLVFPDTYYEMSLV